MKKLFVITACVVTCSVCANLDKSGLDESRTHPIAGLDSHEATFETKTEVESTKRLSREDFSGLINYAEEYLINNINNLTVYRNISGFVRVSIPSPPSFSEKIKDIRLNYWLPNVSINPESIHSHPQYFESMIIHGGYAHEIYKIGSGEDVKYNIYRVFKNKNDQRTANFVNQSSLDSLGAKLANAGSTHQFPKSLIHRILVAEPYTLTINVVFKDDSEETFFDVYKCENFSKEDLKIEKEPLPEHEARMKVSEMISILSNQNQGLIA